jgi:hypothetical protein
MRRRTRIPLSLATAASLLLCLATVALWIRGYWVTDRVTHASARLRRAVAGGGGVFLESLALVREEGNWRDRSIRPVRTPGDYAAWPPSRTAATGPWAHVVTAYDRAALLKDAWGPDLNRALPHVAALAVPRRQTFDNVTGQQVTFILVGRRIWIPYWLLAAATACLPLTRMIAHRRRARRAALNACPTCGYDLRATPDRCPECGTLHA